MIISPFAPGAYDVRANRHPQRRTAKTEATVVRVTLGLDGGRCAGGVRQGMQGRLANGLGDQWRCQSWWKWLSGPWPLPIGKLERRASVT